MGKATLKSFSAAQIDWEEVVQLEIYFSAAQIDWEEVVQLEIPCEIIQ